MQKKKKKKTRGRLTYCWWAATPATIVLVNNYWISSIYECYICELNIPNFTSPSLQKIKFILLIYRNENKTTTIFHFLFLMGKYTLPTCSLIHLQVTYF